MLILGSRVNVSDNSGAIIVGVIKVLGSHNYGIIGDYVIVSIKKWKPYKKVKKHEVWKALIIRHKFPFFRLNGSIIKFHDNSVTLITKKGEPAGTRIFGCIPYELRRKKFMKFIIICASVI